MSLRTQKALRLAKPLLAAMLVCEPLAASGQTPAPAASAPLATSQRGTVNSIEGMNLTLATDTGKQIAVILTPTTRLLQIPPGSTDLKAAQPIGLSAIAGGDRVLVTARASDTPDTMTATRVIVMKSTDIADRNAARQADWQRHGSGGIVNAVDASTGTIAVTSGVRKVAVATTQATIFRRYAGDSVRFEDAQIGTLSQIQPGDQMRVRGTRSEDGASIQAEEIVSGSFRNLAGTVASIDAAAHTVTLKDMATRKTFVVAITANSELRKLPPEAAARLSSRPRPPQSVSGSSVPSNRSTETGTPPPTPSASRIRGAGAVPPDGVRAPRATDSPVATGNPDPRNPGHPGGVPDLAQIFPHLPVGSLNDLKPGDAVMIVVSQPLGGGPTVTAVTMLSGVEPILAASPGGAAPGMTLSPWNVGGGAPGGGGEGGGQ